MRTSPIRWLLICSLAALFASPLPLDGAAVRATQVRVAICQVQAVDGDLNGNLARVDSYVQQAAAAGAKICVFPELVDVGFGSIVTAPTGSGNARPIPGETSDRLGAMAIQHDVWIAAAILEDVPGGGYDTNVLIDNRGKVVLKQRKLVVYPVFGGEPAFPGNYQDLQTVPSPWGPLGVMNCRDAAGFNARGLFPDEQPALMLVSFANPGASLLSNANKIAVECGCPVVGVNMVFPSTANGGKSRFVSAGGSTLWQAGAGEIMKIWDLTVTPPANLRPRVDAGEVQTVRMPVNSVTLKGYATDDGVPGGTLTPTWSKVSGPGTVTFANPGALATQATFSAAGVYVLRLTADDGALNRFQEVSINVLPSGGGDPNLVGHWTFDNTAADSSGSGNDGTLFGNATYSTDTAPSGGSNSHSLLLDGNGDYVRVPHDNSLNATEAVTIALWVKPRVRFPGFYPGGNDWAALVNKGNSWGQENYALAFGAYFYTFTKGMGILCPTLDDALLTPGQWIHVAAVIDPRKKQGRIYVNGVRDHMTINEPTVVTNSDPLYIGTFPAGTQEMIDGKLDDIRLYTRALSDGEIAALVPGAAVNQPLRVDAGQDATVPLPASLSLQGSTTDPSGPGTNATARWTYWRKVSGPGEAIFADRFDPATSVTFSQPGSYVLELRASDGGHLAYDTVSIDATSGSPGSVQFNASAYSIAENGGSATVMVTRTGGARGSISADYSTTNGNAVSGSDYVPSSGTLMWSDGDASSRTFTVQILDDTAQEPDETVGLILQNPTGGASLGPPFTAVLTITDDDTNPDTDGDGLPDSWELTYFPDLTQGAADDPDSDGLTNLGEYTAGTNPTQSDTDGDGLSDGEEVNTYGTNPLNADSDGDGMPDGSEIAYGFDPTNPDQDGNGTLDGLDDWDGDGVTNQNDPTPGIPPAPPPGSSGGSGGSGCGTQGLEFLPLVLVIGLIRRFTDRRT